MNLCEHIGKKLKRISTTKQKLIGGFICILTIEQIKSVKFYLGFFLLFIAGCSVNNNDIIGSWIEPIPGQSGSFQGIYLQSDGKASSINMSTLQYKNWTLQGGNLILEGTSIGNGQTISFVDTFKIDKLLPDTLMLIKRQLKFIYTRKVEP